MDQQWLRRFIRRKKILTLRTRKPKPATDAKAFTKEIAEEYIGVLEELFDGGYLDDPRFIFNLDVSGFKLGCPNALAVGIKGLKKTPVNVKGITF